MAASSPYGGFTIGPSLAEWLIGAHGFGWAWAASGTSAALALGFVLLVPETARHDPDVEPAPMRILHPAAVGPRSDTAYFTVERKGPCWDTIQQTGQVGVHVPESMYGAAGVELTIIPDA